MAIDINEVKRRARPYYSTALHYHNFSHVESALGYAAEILERCRKNKVVIDEGVVTCALIFHDAGYYDDHREKGFSSKEAYALDIALKELKGMGLEAPFIEKVCGAIGSTEKGANFRSNEAKAVRAADLAGLAAPYEDFLDAATRLKQETELLGGMKIPWDAWKAGVKQNLSFYLNQDIRLTIGKEVAPLQSDFHQKARVNVERFMKEPEPKPKKKKKQKQKAA